MPLQVHLDAAVLRPALLGDVDDAHDLDTREHRRQQTARRAVALDQHAVDPVADADAVGERLDVDVAGPQADRLLNDEVDQLDDRGVAVVRRRPAAVAVDSVSVKSMAVSVNSGQHRVHRLGFRLAVVPVDGLDDLLARRQDRLDVFVQDELQLLHGVEVARVAHDDLERAVLLRQRQDDVFAGDRLGHQFDDRRRGW